MKIPTSTKLKAIALAVTMLVGVEGLSTKAYKDTGGVWTICYGETKGVTQGMTATKQQCWTMLQSEAEATLVAIAPYLPATLNPNQYAALVSFCYNVGVYNCKTSTLFKYINKGDYVAAQKEFGRWIYVKKADCRLAVSNCSGIPKRRAAEATLWAKPST
ncbi:endolysin [Pseudomonas phage vB_PpuP-ErraM]